jgi:hypothetical protein
MIGIDHDVVAGAALRNQRQQIGDRAPQHVRGPYLGAQKPDAEARLRHVRDVGQTCIQAISAYVHVHPFCGGITPKV